MSVRKEFTPTVLENRLINFGVSVMKVVDSLDKKNGARSIANQLSRACMSPALNYAEAQVAESKRDFIHKMKISLKELKETNVALRFIHELDYYKDGDTLEKIMDEGNELISIFIASIKTAKGIR